ncbi:hypothetical protein TWF569_009411 [Orbilia oligospora]|uniref:Uncharacterized protein n=1 Tax=Orbilia oligospora TaxID=2813651 RepID=A0A7C8JPQ7_ORBOL|nr:hypothetical protein TWF102_011178 [Orbilia oligospora]KAF3092766.1 hypothetical protein TWF103_011205 [Orbilia oligospora]KAF3095150.1 hypothetical protein TWF706_008012 [Orbilia oligospora]KAF3125078.1 hypothetical protein TWF703_011109 [Orbilia oligospora]KAF3136784.1 hypothetical protein TWF569_009411 [Orbilia oligospora]
MPSSDPIDAIVDQIDSLTVRASDANSANTPTPSTHHPTTSSPDPKEQDSTLATQANGHGAATEAGDAPKKKKKRRKGGKGKTLPSGFEENFVEAPLTAEEYNKDKELYSAKKTVAERIETAVQKYKAKRKLDPLRHQLLEAYYHLGGIKTGAKMFGGLDQKFIKENDTEEIARFKATDYVPESMKNIGIQRVEELDDDYEDPEYTVDFDYVVRAFVTHKIPFDFGMKSPEQIEKAVNTIKNFLNYILYHNVCPEYTDNIKQAVKTCDKAKEELPICAVLSDKFPGDFNKACSTLFGGYWSYMTPREWEKVDGELDFKKPEPGLSKEKASEIYHALICELPHITFDISKTPREIYREYASLEVVSVWLPKPGSPLKLGRIVCKSWTPEEALPITSKWSEPNNLTLYCEKTVAQYAYPKMHFGCTVHELDYGLVYFDEISGVMCSNFLEIRDDKELEVDSDDFDFD